MQLIVGIMQSQASGNLKILSEGSRIVDGAAVAAILVHIYRLGFVYWLMPQGFCSCRASDEFLPAGDLEIWDGRDPALAVCCAILALIWNCCRNCR